MDKEVATENAKKAGGIALIILKYTVGIVWVVIKWIFKAIWAVLKHIKPTTKDYDWDDPNRKNRWN